MLLEKMQFQICISVKNNKILVGLWYLRGCFSAPQCLISLSVTWKQYFIVQGSQKRHGLVKVLLSRQRSNEI